MARINEVQYVNFYTAGSAAYKYEPAPLPKKKQAKLPKVRRKKRIAVFVDPVTVVSMAVALALLITMFVSLGKLSAARQQEERMTQYVQTLQQENMQLQAQYKAGYDLEEIRQIATAMGMIPAEQAQQITLQVQLPPQETENSAWDNFCTFLAGLFA